ncbi:diguanylate cyclase (GGDEF) domain-containing protein [Xenococcus sp. PCC 7305]|uniref:GGDEF domain-containing response regulator n=1 Tax=Xenococcus sp. PCC 7305 TaxID=102125 RepID=UPI0002ABBEFB|nr:diguanylate cyclase [Xenococcus sp. PCC 7305]ELS02585.1 diguanylate cyclase (GGDEF) domain-containing protein [Xenococcus sp. PCC 7305]
MEHKQDTILIVDHNPYALSHLTTTLNNKGYQTKKAFDGNKAVNFAYEAEPDLILLDLETPPINGYQVCSSLKDSDRTNKIPIIFVSDSHDRTDRVKAIEIGGVDYITKPFYLEEVIARIERQLEIQRLQKLLRQQNILLQKEIERRIKVETALREANQELHCLATIDTLTGIANRRKFDYYLEKEWRRLARQQAPLSLILLDIDYFKRYNDSKGHQEGDLCLKKVASAIAKTVHRPADLVARYGGEEFAVILPHTDLDGAVYIGNKIKMAIQKLNIKHPLSDISDIVTTSQGISSAIPTADISAESLIYDADIALYDAKRQGRNQLQVKAA